MTHSYHDFCILASTCFFACVGFCLGRLLARTIRQRRRRRTWLPRQLETFGEGPYRSGRLDESATEPPPLECEVHFGMPPGGRRWR